MNKGQIENLISTGYNILLLIGSFFFLIFLFSPVMELSGILKSSYANMPVVIDFKGAVISIMLIVIPMFFLAHRKIVLGEQLIKNSLFLFLYSVILIPFLSLCFGPPWPGGTMHIFPSNVVPLLVCPEMTLQLSPPVDLLLILIFVFNIFQMVAHAYYYIRIKKKMEPLVAFGISSFFGVVLVGVLVRLFELAGNLLWR